MGLFNRRKQIGFRKMCLQQVMHSREICVKQEENSKKLRGISVWLGSNVCLC